jgi:hypothetical protein
MQSLPNPIPLATENQRVPGCEVFEGPYRLNVEHLSSGRGGTDVDHERFPLAKLLDFGLFFVFTRGFDTE